MHNESGDAADNELVRERRDDSDRDSSTGWRSSFQRRSEAWRKERLLTFQEE